MSSLRFVPKICTITRIISSWRPPRRRPRPASRWGLSTTASVGNDDITSNSYRLGGRSAWVVHPDLEPYILSSSEEAGPAAGTPFGVHFLGTGAGSPSLHRGCSAAALTLGGNTYLFDAGEGVQRACMLSRRVHHGDITRIFISHLHGDHIFGLPGLLLYLQTIAKVRKQQTQSHYKGPKPKVEPPRRVQIYGPVGLYNYIATSVSLSCTELKHVHVDVFELTGGSRRWVHPGSLLDYPEFHHRGLRRHSIPQEKDGTWTLQVAQEITTIEDARRFHSSPRGVYVKAAQIMHVTKLQCFGFVVKEPWTQPRNIDVERAKSAGVAPGSAYSCLKLGFAVPSDDGSRMVQPEEVYRLDDLPYKSRKLAFLGDCCAVPGPMAELCADADILVHEATFLESQSGHKVDYGGHSTAAMAGRVADRVGAKVLLLNHISASHQNSAAEEKIGQEAASAIEGPTKVQLAYDLMDIYVPRKGFPTEWKDEKPEKGSPESKTESLETSQKPNVDSD
eukprot:scaffold7495_cov158-Amphora_coffeaeformis.AAC.5